MPPLALTALVWLGGPLSAGPPSPSTILGGEEVPASVWTNVVATAAPHPDTPGTLLLCTGTYLGQGVVLTAAHCLVGARDADDITVYFGDTIHTTEPDRVATAANFATHPDAHIHDHEINLLDFGYVLLDQEIAAVPTIAPIVDQGEWDAAMRVGAEITIVGFGATGPDDEGAGVKREVPATISDISDAGDRFQAGGDGGDACRGDSGGPAFIQLASGDWRLAGLIFEGFQPCGTKGNVFGVPYPVLRWLRAEADLDLLPADCPDGDCLDLAPDSSDSCACDNVDSTGGLTLLVPFLALLRRRTPAMPVSGRSA